MEYTTEGAIRGTCGHRHKTLKAAWACITRDARDCRKARGHTDRVVLHADGTDLEADEVAWIMNQP